jgi:hypothetical protein
LFLLSAILQKRRWSPSSNQSIKSVDDEEPTIEGKNVVVVVVSDGWQTGLKIGLFQLGSNSLI